VLHSFPTSFRQNYEGVIAEFWRQVACSIPSGGRVLDLASGNGSVPLLLLPYLAEDAHVDAVDAARIAAEEHPSNTDSRIRFHSGVWMEQLPFQDASFDCVCSQFGIEYAEQAAAWDEVFRVLAEHGQVACVIHHRASAFYAVAQSESRHLQWLLATDGVLAAACEVAGWLELMRNGQQVGGVARVQADASRSRFNAIQEVLESRIREGSTPDVLIEVRAQIGAILANAPKPRETMMAYRELLDQSFVRCRELVACALDVQQIDELASSLRSRRRGATVRIEELAQEQGVLAWGLRVAT
jgi:SAM-dependent methyltransferase